MSKAQLSLKTENAIISAAKKWAEWGMHPIALHGLIDGACTCGKYPCGNKNRNAGKHPISVSWQSSPLDMVALERELERGPRNLGLRMGKQPNGKTLVAIDVDDGFDDLLKCNKSGSHSLERLISEHGGLPQTLEQVTGSGGRHLVFEWALDDFGHFMAKHHMFRLPPCPTNSASKIGLYIDVRGQGGQIVAAPSMHISGKRYARTGETRLFELMPAPIPYRWMGLISDTVRRVR